MTPLQQQFEELKQRYPNADLRETLTGPHVVIVPDVLLPQGWSKPSTEVKFAAPVGYPFSAPDCFWTDADLRLANNAMPQATGQSACPDGTTPLWFSWHVGGWNPNTDSLLTYLNVIKRRFADIR